MKLLVMSQGTHEHPTLADQIAALSAQEAIRALKAKYATGSDLAIGSPSHDNAVALAALFTDDASADYGPFGRYEGRDALIHAFENVIPGAASWSRHYVTNPVIEVNGNVAKGEWYFLVYSVLRGGPSTAPVNLFGSYEERYVKTENGWRISSLIARFVEPPR